MGLLEDDDEDEDDDVISSAPLFLPLFPTTPGAAVDPTVVNVDDIGTFTGIDTVDPAAVICTRPAALALAMRMSKIC